ncbi:AmiR/NasT family two-component response regulator [Paraburkholderia sp. GAS334]
MEDGTIGRSVGNGCHGKVRAGIRSEDIQIRLDIAAARCIGDSRLRWQTIPQTGSMFEDSLRRQ